jgi:hypothetical protein
MASRVLYRDAVALKEFAEGKKMPEASKDGLLPQGLVVLNAATFGIFLLLALIIGLSSTSPTVESVSKTVAVAFAMASGVLGPANAIFNVRYQRDLTLELNQATEKFRTNLSASLELKKTVLASQIKAFDAMLDAAYSFHFIIRELPSNLEPEKRREMVSEADKKASQASAFIWHLSEQDRRRWFAVYQRSRFLAGVLEKENKIQDPRFDKQAVLLGSDIRGLEAAGQAIFDAARQLEDA